MEAIRVSGLDGSAIAVHLNGATVTEWKNQRSDNAFFVSERSEWQEGRPIRGGIPLAFPQFAGDGPLPNHGLARTLPWTVAEQATGYIQLCLQESAASRELWPYAFDATYSVTFNASSFSSVLEITNPHARAAGSAMQFQALQHTYYQLDAVTTLQLSGLEGRTFLDKLTGKSPKQAPMTPLTIQAETDAIFVPSQNPRPVLLQLEGAPVIWNPWIAKSAAMADFGDEEYQHMVCIEPGCVSQPVTLEPGATFRLEQHITLLVC
ncbi:uncharacterized protein MONBRDRAFT_16468 [Monosiga brevicollis MX1]|uniref:glucose-6-phosphate 1-epimerase n=1 Tax=Monosiga brevicollis TaxID=81824 RepID=A9UX39_MONBE|nr:uncharacterized protein MONBRDRAFT_16468 [Monosiga brevicollis MX1]EDQ90149.1 predicted protein [Monosiga brevicollis MX1]|eukprot:XP_001744916.1 hypothetical protein [Monosiga brevicollis MX1]